MSLHEISGSVSLFLYPAVLSKRPFIPLHPLYGFCVTGLIVDIGESVTQKRE